MNPSDHGHERQQRIEEVLATYMQRVDRGEQVDRAAFVAEHPELADELRAYFAGADQVEQMAGPQLDATIDSDPGRPSAVPPIDVVRYFGDYELLEEIARGGMGVVFKARQVTLNRLVAVKMILSGQLASPADVERFHAEAEAAANLDHPGIVPIFEVGEHQGQHYFSMGFIDGRSLSARVTEGPLPAREAAQLMRTVCDAVQYAHEHDVIHRDLKPANILLDREGRPRVTDFGLAKRVQGDSGLTATGQILGTPSFMPPEQALGKWKLVGPATDVYALGAILYTLLTGRPPFQAATSVDTLRQVLEKEPSAPHELVSNVPRDLESIALKCLEKQIPQRYASARELADDLQRFLDGRPVLARRGTSLERGLRWLKRYSGGMFTLMFVFQMFFGNKRFLTPTQIVAIYSSLFGALVGMVVIFALPAGILMGIYEQTQNRRPWWVAVIEIPCMIVRGMLLLIGFFSVFVAANSGSKWLTSDGFLRDAVEVLIGYCCIIIFIAIIHTLDLFRTRWREFLGDRLR